MDEIRKMLEDRLTSPKPEAGSWVELSGMLDGPDSPLRREMSSRWDGQGVWSRFLEWERGWISSLRADQKRTLRESRANISASLNLLKHLEGNRTLV